MEWDFLGINGKDSEKEEGRGSRQDSVFLGGSAMQWPFSNKMLMSFKAAQEEKPKTIIFDHVPSSGFQPVTTADASHLQAPQKCFSLDRQGAHKFAMHAYQPQITDSFGASTHHVNEAMSFPVVSHISTPVSVSSPFFKVHGYASSPNLPVTTALKPQPLVVGIGTNTTPVVGSGVGAFAPRKASKSSGSTAQLTIFYAGSMNVYNDVPLDKAQAIMFLASKGCSATSNAANPRPETPVHVTSPCSAHSGQISVTSHPGAHSGTVSSNTDEVAGAKNVGPLPPPSQHEPSSKTTNPMLPRAAPQARKASLARFLEKRKERVTNAMPYSCAKKSSENSVGFEGADASNKCSSADLSLSSNREESWRLGHQKNSDNDCGECPSTKLEM